MAEWHVFKVHTFHHNLHFGGVIAVVGGEKACFFFRFPVEDAQKGLRKPVGYRRIDQREHRKLVGDTADNLPGGRASVC